MERIIAWKCVALLQNCCMQVVSFVFCYREGKEKECIPTLFLCRLVSKRLPSSVSLSITSLEIPLELCIELLDVQ
jgi:hypothetical protein